MSIVVTPIPRLIDLAAPAFTLGTANAAGSAATAVASDSTLLVFDTTLPAAVGTAATGSATVAPRRDHVHSGAAQATQAALEAETDEDTYAAPDMIKYSPGVAKAWCLVNQTGTQAIIGGASYNVASINDQGVGRTRVTFTTQMSGAAYAVAGSAATGVAICRSQDVHIYDMDCQNSAGSYIDDPRISGVCHGEQ